MNGIAKVVVSTTVNPVLLAQGKPVLAGLGQDVRLRLRDVRRFRSGNVLLSYEPADPGSTSQSGR